MKKNITIAKLFLLVKFLLVYNFSSFTQDLSFPCDSNFEHHSMNWVDNDLNRIYDTLNKIDFSEIELEIRYWTNSMGHYDLIVLRKRSRLCASWKAYYFSDFQKLKNKTQKGIFKNNQINFKNRREVKKTVNQLFEQDILRNKQQTFESLKQYVDLTKYSISHDTHHYIEVLAENCKRKYSFSSWTSLDVFDEVEEIKKLNEIRKIFRQLKTIEK